MGSHDDEVPTCPEHGHEMAEMATVTAYIALADDSHIGNPKTPKRFLCKHSEIAKGKCSSCGASYQIVNGLEVFDYGVEDVSGTECRVLRARVSVEIEYVAMDEYFDNKIGGIKSAVASLQKAASQFMEHQAERIRIGGPLK